MNKYELIEGFGAGIVSERHVAENAFYYARVIEIPTPRWVLYDKVRLGAEIPKEAKLIQQERAYTSPIWYTPQPVGTGARQGLRTRQ